jgi:hypothetical protein
LRGFSGAITAALLLLALFVIAASVIAAQRGYPGPGLLELCGHSVAAVLAVLLQRFADRRRGALAWLSALAVIVVAGATLWLWWWR